MNDHAEFIITNNINRFRRLLDGPLLPETRRTIEHLLADAEIEFAQLGKLTVR